ncbi:hypothetical protein F5Y16DRAFT_360446 [Xylariaceae sp. FL0255]|nr:hypothetical protein F5Y16DRAFT_360446 [Xylariaceae sp. FL0255]
MADQPPPPPPHGTNPRSSNSNLPPGKYDIFIIPPHSSGSGFLYLPSLKPNVNSFAAGFASALVLVILFQSMAPAFRIWWSNFQGMGNMGMMLLVVAVGVGAWAMGRAQNEAGPSQGGGGASSHSWSYNPGNGGHPGAGSSSHSSRAPESEGPPPPPPPHGTPPPQPGSPPNNRGNEKPKTSWQQRPQADTKGSWEKAREETRKKEEERKAKEAEQRKRDEIARRLKEMREKEARERAKRDQDIREKLQKEANAARERQEREAREARERQEKEAREAHERQEKEARDKAEREREAREREQQVREKVEREAREREAKERQEREAREKEQKAKEKYEQEQKEKAQREKELKERRTQEARERELRERLEREKALREKLEREAKEREEARKAADPAKEGAKIKESEAPRKSTYAFSSVGEKTNPWPNGKPPMQPSPSPTKPDPTPSAARRPPPPTARTFHGTDDDAYSYRPYDQPKAHTRRRSGETVFTESSYAASHSTSRTTPPPSMRGPYTTKDPDKIVIKAVYGFLNQFSKTPASQLMSGVHPVTDGLILRITTEGLFIDDDVRGVPQREWDVKAWTLKLMEVFCPSPSADSGASPRPNKAGASRFKFASNRGQSKTLMGDDADGYLDDLLHSCKDSCRLGPHNGSDTASSGGGWKHRGLHVLRATIRDQEGKRYLFVLGEEEGWKVAVGLQRLRKGTQVRQLGIQPMSAIEARNSVEMLGW